MFSSNCFSLLSEVRMKSSARMRGGESGTLRRDEMGCEESWMGIGPPFKGGVITCNMHKRSAQSVGPDRRVHVTSEPHQDTELPHTHPSEIPPSPPHQSPPPLTFLWTAVGYPALSRPYMNPVYSTPWIFHLAELFSDLSTLCINS